MSALYVMNYQGQTGLGTGALYIGKGVVVGAGVGNTRFQGTYAEHDGHLQAQVTMTAGVGGATLVTGAAIAAGQSIQIAAELPKNFSNGAPQRILVGGQPVQVVFEKVGDIP